MYYTYPMNISVTHAEPLVDHLTVTVDAADYHSDYENQLKTYRKRITLPGFRQGMVPASLVRSRFGQSILADQLNQMVGKGLSQHITDQGIRFVGRPYLVGDTFAELDPAGDRPYAFTFEIGREPEFELNVSALPDVPQYEVTISEADLDRQILRARYQHGPNESAEKVEGDAKTAFNLVGVLKVEGEPEPAEGEVSQFPFPRFFGLHTVLVPTLASEVYGKKPGDMIRFEPAQAFTSAADGAAQLRLEPAEYARIANRTLVLDVRQVFLNRPAPLGQELYAKVLALPEGDSVDDEETFRARLREKLDGQAKQMGAYLESDRLKRILLEAHPFELPDRILQRWLVDEFDEFKKEGAIQGRYAQYRDELRLHLIQKKLAERYPNLALGESDIREAVTEKLMGYFAQPGAEAPQLTHSHDHDHDHGHDHPHDHSHDHDHDHVASTGELSGEQHPALQAGLVEQLVDRFMQDDNFIQRETAALRSQRFFEVMTHEVVRLTPTPVSYTDFERIIATGG
jgi:trigger factor